MAAQTPTEQNTVYMSQSVIPRSFFKQKLACSTNKLYAANATAINTYGQHRKLSIDLRRQRLVDSITSLSQKGKFTKTALHSISTINGTHAQTSPLASVYTQLLSTYNGITEPLYGPRAIKNTTYRHHIVTEGPPVACRPRKLAGEKLKAVKTMINTMVDQGILRPSDSRWAMWRLQSHQRPNNSGSISTTLGRNTFRETKI
ncbi:hypothetical protein TSAR_003170 [Trichomalopsis sarcophagae]|uniref:Uncharacterized protein n=1 Tax=Trichomalopsis sarcophagae TaxID=543379 RepID=A0A232EGG5_9HYME|nr:hypothetical protein TSAR_003170 [Trichomalopsis sarcophagae]